MELKRYFALFWRWLWLLILGAVIGGGAAYGASHLQVPRYQATTTLLISEAPSGSASGNYAAVLVSERLASTYLQLLAARPVLEEVVRQLHLSPTDAGVTGVAQSIAGSVNIYLVEDTQLIKLQVTRLDAEQATAIANTIPAVFREYYQTQQASRFAESKASLLEEIQKLDQQISEAQDEIQRLGEVTTGPDQVKLERLQADLTQFRLGRTSLVQSYESLRLAEAQSINNILVVEPALIGAPIVVDIWRNTFLAAAVGLLLAGAVVFLIEYLDDTVKTPQQVLSLLNLPVVGVIASMSNRDMAEGPITASAPRSPITEAFRGLRTNLQFSSLDRPLRQVLVTSVGPGEGKSTVTANLAIVMAQAGHRVVLMDADLRRPSQHKIFDKPNRFGISDTILQDPIHLNGALQSADVNNLYLMSTGPLPPNPAELLGSRKMQSLLEAAHAQADLIVIDTPPISAVTDAVVLARQMDAVILVIETGRTRIGAVQHTKEQLERVGANLVGVVLNKAPLHRDSYYYSHYYYYYNSYYAADEGNEPDDKSKPQPQRNLWERLFGRRPHTRRRKTRPAAPVTEGTAALLPHITAAKSDKAGTD